MLRFKLFISSLQNQSRFPGRALRGIFFTGLTLIALASPASADPESKVNNFSFENPIGGSGDWDQTANRGISTPAIAGAPDGSRVLRLTENDIVAPQDFTFTFQVLNAVAKQGDIITLSAYAREVVVDGDDDGQMVIEYQTASGTQLATTITSVTSGTFQKLTASGTAPLGTGKIVITLRIQNAQRGDGTGTTSIVDFDNIVATINGFPILLEASPASANVSPGEMRMVALRMRNLTAVTQTGVELIAEPQAGLQIKADQGALDGRPISSRPGSVIFGAGNLEPGQDSILSFPVILSSGVVPGKNYTIKATANSSAGAASQTIFIRFKSELDPVFDEGTIIGKVFNDIDQNGVQDGCAYQGTEELCSGKESGIPWVRLVTEEGIVIVTDEYGRYHIPAVKPGRHIVKIDSRTLPEGTKFVTEEAFLVKTTPGIMNKANFAVLVPPSEMPKQFEKDLMVTVTQGLDTSRPMLGVTMNPGVLRLGVGMLEREANFKLKLNYPEMVKSWYLEVRDEMGREVWTGYGIS